MKQTFERQVFKPVKYIQRNYMTRSWTKIMFFFYFEGYCINCVALFEWYLIGSGSIGSARFWLPGSGYGSAKICGSTDPDPRGKISTKNCKKNFFTLKTQIWTFEKKKDYKISSFLDGSSRFRIKISEKNKTKNLKIIV